MKQFANKIRRNLAFEIFAKFSLKEIISTNVPNFYTKDHPIKGLRTNHDR